MIDLKLKKMLPDDPIVNYNIACSYALLGKNEQALDSLRKSILLGYTDHNHMLQDEDLKSLRDLPEFQDIINWCKIISKEK